MTTVCPPYTTANSYLVHTCQLSGKAKVPDQHTVSAEEEDVLRLQDEEDRQEPDLEVPVDHAVVVHVADSGGHLDEDSPGPPLCILPCARCNLAQPAPHPALSAW